MKHKIVSHHQKDFNPKYNPHIKQVAHPNLRRTKHVFKWTLLSILISILVAVIATAGGIWLYRDANDQAKRAVAEKVAKNLRPESPVYDQSSLNQHSNHNVDKELMARYAQEDSFISKINYDSKKDVAKVYLTKSSAKAINYASSAKKGNSNQLNQAIKEGVKIDNTLSNQAVEVANQAHDGYFTFAFANAKGYQAPNTKTGNFNEK